MRVFVAGAAGAIGRYLVPRLIERGHQVTATTRSPARAEALRGLGAAVAMADGLDGAAVREAVARAEPDAVVHQMTALAGKADLKHFDRWFAVTNRLRTQGTDHLLAAAEAAGVRRFIAQSYTGWNNARTGGPVKSESDPLDPDPARNQRQTMAAIEYLERRVAETPMEGLVLRYGNFYGPGASEGTVTTVRKRMLPVIGGGTGVWSWIHLDDAAAATVAALERGAPGVYHIADDEPAEVAEWLPYLAEAVGARPPLRIPAWLGRLAVGTVGVRWLTEGRGASNAKARRELDWQPAWRTWREGFRYGLTNGSAGLASAKGGRS